MLKIYKKQEKSMENPSGYIEIDDINKPFLFCISAQDNHDKSIYGTIRQGVEAARIYTSKSIGAGYKIKDFPIDFLGFRFVKEAKNQDNALELVDKYLYPYLIKDGIEKENILKRARQMNFMTYCDGTKTYKKIELELVNRLINKGLNKEDIEEILSNIHLVAIGTQVDIRTFKGTCISLTDINDKEIWNNITYKIRSIIKNRNTKILIGKNNNQGYVYYDGTGEHELTEYFRDGVLIKPILHFVISKIIESSIHDKNLNSDDILDELKLFIKNGINQNKLLSILDNNVNFGNAPKYSKEELQLRKELDNIYTNYEIEHRELEALKEQNDKKAKTIEKIIEGIKKYSSDITFYQILVEMGYWQAPNNMNPYQYSSDKKIREIYEKDNDKNVKL